jgi:hypothetical protein
MVELLEGLHPVLTFREELRDVTEKAMHIIL